MTIKGRHTVVVAVRIPEDVFHILSGRAEKKGETVGEYIKNSILHSVNAPVYTTPEIEPNVNPDPNPNKNLNVSHSVNKPTLTELQAMIDQKQGRPTTIETSVPWYNPEYHTTGDTVRMRDSSTKAVRVVTL